MKNLTKATEFFFIPYILILAPSTYALLIWSKAEIHLWMNQYHSVFFDQFFKYLTNLGDGMTPVIIGIVFILFSFRKSVYILVTYIGTGLFAQILKRLFFSHMVRPVKFFDGMYHLHLVPGVHMYYEHSFPSGHATTAFALFLCLAIIADRKYWSFLFSILAILVAYSRIYLSQHFLIDAYVGSLIGTAGALLLNRYIYHSDKKWLELSIIQLLRKKKNEG